MPYSLKGNCVYRGGKVLKCYDNHADALAYFRALKINVKESLVEFSMHISKSSTTPEGVMRWQAVNSDTESDLYGEKMSLELYQKMLGYIKNEVPPPNEYRDRICSDFWCGGMPYLSISHYPDLGGMAVPGEPLELFIDGKQLKAKGILYDSKLGKSVWKSLKQDEQSQNEEKIRISIAFLDLAHKHGEDGTAYKRLSATQPCKECATGIGNKIYIDGYLVHLALTRVPVNPRTIMEIRSMTKKTRKEDAKSIVQDEDLVNEIDTKAVLENKSDVLVEMADTEEELVEENLVEKGNSGYLVADNGNGQPALPTKKDGKLDHRLMGAAWAALHGGYRGNKYEGQGKEDAIAKLKRLYARENMSVPNKSDIVEESFTHEELGLIEENMMDKNMMDKKKKAGMMQGQDEDEMMDTMDDEQGDNAVDGQPMDKKKKVHKAFTDEQVAELAEIIKSIIPVPSDTVSTEPASVNIQEMAEKSVLQVSMEQLEDTVVKAQTMDVAIEEKLVTINPALENLVTTIRDIVKNSVSVAQAVSENVDVPSKLILEKLTQLNDTISTLTNDVALLKSQVATPITNNNTIPLVPRPRSLAPDVVRSVVQKSQAENENKLPSVRELSRRSVGIVE